MDANEIYGVVNSRIQNSVDFQIIDTIFEGNRISIVQVAPSLTKPHLLVFYKHKDRDYQNEIFTRKGTSTVLAGKDDIELMYTERDSIQVDYKLSAAVSRSSIDFDEILSRSDNEDLCLIRFYVTLSIINLGRRPCAIRKVVADFVTDPEQEEKLGGENFHLNKITVESGSFEKLSSALIIKPNTVVDCAGQLFFSKEFSLHPAKRGKLASVYKKVSPSLTNFRFIDVFGKHLACHVEEIQ